MHGFLSRDGIHPAELLSLGRAQLQPYQTVELRAGTVKSACPAGGHFRVTLEGGVEYQSRKLLLATGVVDELPQVEGLKALYGRSVFHCPYCDGWEVRDQPLSVYGPGTKGVGLATTLLCWGRDIVLCTDGPADLPDDDS